MWVPKNSRELQHLFTSTLEMPIFWSCCLALVSLATDKQHLVCDHWRENVHTCIFPLPISNPRVTWSPPHSRTHFYSYHGTTFSFSWEKDRKCFVEIGRFSPHEKNRLVGALNSLLPPHTKSVSSSLCPQSTLYSSQSLGEKSTFLLWVCEDRQLKAAFLSSLLPL